MKKNRNPKRAALEERFGYDTKHAAHLIRLMNEGQELLLTGQITFPRPERAQLLEIIEGSYSYDKLMRKVEDFDDLFKFLCEQSTLPHDPNRTAINKLYLSIIGQREEI